MRLLGADDSDAQATAAAILLGGMLQQWYVNNKPKED